MDFFFLTFAAERSDQLLLKGVQFRLVGLHPPLIYSPDIWYLPGPQPADN